MNQLVRGTGVATALPIPQTRTELLALAAEALHAEGETLFGTIHGVEDMELAKLEAISTAGTIFAPVVTALNAHGVPTKETVGDVMRILSLTQHDVHEIACWCHEQSATMTAFVGGNRLQTVLGHHPPA